jgi:hypothetical protein
MFEMSCIPNNHIGVKYRLSILELVNIRFEGWHSVIQLIWVVSQHPQVSGAEIVANPIVWAWIQAICFVGFRV